MSINIINQKAPITEFKESPGIPPRPIWERIISRSRAPTPRIKIDAPSTNKTPYKKFTAHTVGLEHPVFYLVTTKNLDKFSEFKGKIAKHVAV